jgi:competence protein ComEC
VHPLLRAELAPPSRGRAALELAPLRRRGAERLLREGEGGGLLAALGLGEAVALSAGPRRALARLGLSHLVAVSGLHLWLVAGPAFLLAASALRHGAWLAARIDTRRAALVLAVAVGGLYAVFTGLAAPVQRALVFLALLALAQLTRRRLTREGVFAAAGLGVAVLDPAAPFAPGVQLSFAAAAALAYSAPGPQPTGSGWLRALAAGLATTLRVSASATAATAALVAFHFGVVSPLGWLANAIGVPLTSFVFLPLALAVGGVAVAQPELEVGALATGMALAARLAGAALDAVVVLADWVPARSAVTPGWLGLALSAALALLCMRAERTALRLGLALLAAAAPLLGTAPALDPPVPRVLFLDVGQGDATVVQGRAGSLLVDGGVAIPGRFDAGERVVLPALGALGVRRLDLVVASHADLDHAGGLAAVLREVPTRRLWLPPGGRVDPAFAGLVALARARGVAIEERSAGDPLLWLGDIAVETLWPPRAGPRSSRNDASLVLRVRVNGRVVLLPGDVEKAAEAALVGSEAVLRADLLKLAHHGSRSSSTRAFLRAAAPALAIVSAPRYGRFGMPHPETVRGLAALAIPWHWTGRDGALLVSLGPSRTLRAFAPRKRRGRAGAGSEACSAEIPSSSSRPAGWTNGSPPPGPR